ncbi:MAG: cation:proton antiporter [Proteobacteria bacterium]|nr:cation:proton antiporter [Pseudomonadota bacterium]
MSDTELSQFLLALALLLCAALAGGHLFARFGMPRVVGEICGGLVLGPSVLGLIAPSLQLWVFQGFTEQAVVLSAFYWLGMVMLMFTAGFSITLKLGARDRILVLALVVGGLGPPFVAGWLAAPWLSNSVAADPLAFTLVVAIATSVTSIPVISRIFIDLDMMKSNFAQLTLVAAAVQDLVLWVMLAVATAVQQETQVAIADIGGVVAATLAFAVASVLFLPALLRLVGRATISDASEPMLTSYMLLFCLGLVAVASLFAINLVFGALLAGLVIGRFQSAQLAATRRRISDMAIWFFVPIYFALVGLKLDLPGDFSLMPVVGFILLSSLVKIASVALAARLVRTSTSRALDFGITMNARGGPGIVLASVAHATGIIDDSLFVAFVLASVFTSLVTGSWLRWRLSRDTAFAV